MSTLTEITIPADKIGDLKDFTPVEGTWSVSTSDDQDAVIPAVLAEVVRLTGLPTELFQAVLFQGNGLAADPGNSDGVFIIRRTR